MARPWKPPVSEKLISNFCHFVISSENQHLALGVTLWSPILLLSKKFMTLGYKDEIKM